MKLGLICSQGGHFYQLWLLEPWWRQYDRFWVTLEGPDTLMKLGKEKFYLGFAPVRRNIINAILNLFLAVLILLRESPDVLFSTGAGIAPPFFIIGKLLGIKLIFLETGGFIDRPTLSGKLISFVADKFLVQYPSSLKFYRRAEFVGGLM